MIHSSVFFFVCFHFYRLLPHIIYHHRGLSVVNPILSIIINTSANNNINFILIIYINMLRSFHYFNYISILAAFEREPAIYVLWILCYVQ